MFGREFPTLIPSMNIHLVLPISLILSSGLLAGPALGSALSPRIANYTIAVTLDVEGKTLEGHEELSWHNTSPDTITSLQFHLYLNGFRNKHSTFLRGRRGPSAELSPGDEGWIDLLSVISQENTDLTPAVRFVRPDDGNQDDSTVVEIPLARALLPGDSVVLAMRFRARLPRIRERTGYAGTFFMVAQWFPKIGVYEPAGFRGRQQGGWNCHQFHHATEFYADFGVYTVAITLPQHFVVGASGVQLAESPAGDSLKTVTFCAEDVHDFAWTASPDFVVVREQWRGVALRVLMQKQRLAQASRYTASAIAALSYLSSHLGPYPYPSLTIVDPAFRGSGAGGMEYPTLITTGTLWGMPDGVRFPEEVTVHEFTHQYWYGMVATNETEEAWMDEGLTTYYTARIMDETYGPTRSLLDLPGLRAGRGERDRSGYTRMRDPRCAPIAATTWKVKDPEFGRIVYYKTATMLATLERMIGRSAMDSVMRTYFGRWRFAHPAGRDLVATFNTLVPRLNPDRYGAGLDWFFEQILYDTVTCDFELESISTEPVQDPGGTTTRGATLDTLQSVALYTSAVTVCQRGSALLPTTVRVVFEDGKEVIEEWDGRSSSMLLRYTRPARVISAEVDPERRVLLDLNLLNNSRTTRPSNLPAWSFAARLGLILQSAVQLLAVAG